jgi:hypothetical protein
MKLYVISANTYEDSWGAEINIFGVYDEEHVQRALEELEEKYSYFFKVDEINLNEHSKTYLGGYFE